MNEVNLSQSTRHLINPQTAYVEIKKKYFVREQQLIETFKSRRFHDRVINGSNISVELKITKY